MYSKQLQLASLVFLFNFIASSSVNAGEATTAVEDYLDPLLKVTAIESSGFFVAVGHDNYAFYCDLLTSTTKWKTLSVNFGVVTVTTDSNLTVSKKYYELGEETQKFIEKLKLSFTENLVGLELFDTKTNNFAFGVGLGKSPSPGYVRGAGNSYSSTGSTYSDGNNYVGYNNPGSVFAVNSLGINGGSYAPGAYSQNGYFYRPGLKYENLASSSLNNTLDGDIYEFDLFNSVLTIFSSDVSLKEQRDLNIVFRDYDYFTWSQANMPSHINRFFYIEGVVFFVYNDGTVISKLDDMLDSVELELVLNARGQLKVLLNLREVESVANSQSSLSL